MPAPDLRNSIQATLAEFAEKPLRQAAASLSFVFPFGTDFGIFEYTSAQATLLQRL